MKCFYSLIPAVVFSAGLVALIGINQSVNQSTELTQSTQLTGDLSADNGLIEYELQRLRDPETGKIPANIRQLELEYAATLPGYFSPLEKGVRGLSSTLNWQSRGPWNVGGRTRAFAIDITNPNKFLASSTSAGMWMSSNGGTSWSQTWGITHQSVSCIAQDTRAGKTSTWYIGTGEGYGQSASGGGAYYLGNGMYKSTDGGATWNVLSSTSSGTPQTFENVWDVIWNTATNPADTVNDVVYAAVYNAVYKSINGGTSWTLARGTGLTGPYSYFTDVAVSSSGIIYVTLSSDGGAQKGIWRSPDGVTWTKINPTTPSFPTTYGRIKIGISPADENQVYFWMGTTTGFGICDTNFLGDIECNSLWKYYDTLGGKWFDLSANLPTTGGPHDKQHVQGGYDMVIKPHPTDTNIVFLGGTNLYRSTDGFKTPNNTKFIGGYKEGSSIPLTIGTYLNHHPDQHEVVFDAVNNILYNSNDGGIYKSANFMADTVAWTPLNNGYLTSMFYTVALDHVSSNDSTIIGGTQDNNSWFVNSQNPQAIWKSIFFGDGSYCAIANNKLNYYFSIQNGKMQKMQLDAAGNVLARRRIDPIGGTGYLFINPYILDPNNNNLMYLAGGKNLWRNDNLNSISLVSPTSPTGWDSISTGWTMFPDTVPTANAKITALAVSNNPANILYYGTSNRRVYRIDNAHTGTPIAVDISWVAASPNGFPVGGNVSCIAVDPLDAGNVMVSFSNYNVYSIFYSTNADSTAPTWKKVAGNLEQNFNLTGSGTGSSVRWVSIMPVSDGVVYLAATSTGLYATDTLIEPSATADSTLWIQQGASTIGNSICDMIDFRTSDGLAAVATHSRGIFTTHITSVSEVPVNEYHASEFRFQVYPNPSNGMFNVKWLMANGNTSHPAGGHPLGETINHQSLTIEIYNVHGEKVARSVIPNPSFVGINSVRNLTIDISSQPSGVYYCVLKSGGAIQTRKIILL